MKAWKKVLIVVGIIVLHNWLIFRYVGLLGDWYGKSYEKYEDVVVQDVRFWDDLPEGAEDFRFKCHNAGLGAYSMIAFTLEGQAYSDFINSIDEKYSEPTDEYGLTGKKVSETRDYYDSDGDYVGFKKIRFNYVIDDSIEDYTICYYDSYDFGTETFAIVTKPDTGRIIIFSGGYD